MPLLDHLFTVIFLYCFLSSVSVLMYRHDKKAAIDNKRRISENNLHFLDLLGGWPGGLYAQKRYRHKTHKLSFRFVFWCTVVLNVTGVSYSFSQSGRIFLANLLGS